MRICFFNLQDFFLLTDKNAPSDISEIDEADWQLCTQAFVKNKPLEHLHKIQQLLLEIDADLNLFCEVGGSESIDNFSRYFPCPELDFQHIPTNSDRGIDLAMAHKRLCKFRNTKSIKQVYLGKNRVSFSRAVGATTIRVDKRKPLTIFFTHLKSKLSKGDDYQGTRQRKREVTALVELIKRETKKGHHVIVAGDLNGDAGHRQVEPEFNPLIDSQLVSNPFELLKIDKMDRVTHSYFQSGARPQYSQLDYFFVSKSLESAVSDCRVMRFEDFYLSEKKLPKSLKDKLYYPSDHFPIVLEIDQNKL